MADTEVNVGAHRVVAVIVLLVAGVLSLPVAAAFFDGEGSENWILPVQLLAMAVIGGVVGRLLPGLAGAGVTTARSTVVGVAAGLVAAVLGVVLFFLILNGFDGA